MILSAIAAMAANRVIGVDGGLPWRIPEDFKFFKDKTTDHIMIMGRKTFESLGGPLPKRLHVVITRQEGYEAKGAVVFQTIDAALEFCKKEVEAGKWPNEVFIIGGGEIYKQMMPVTDRIYLTEIKRSVPGDAKFPEFDTNLYREIERRPRAEPEPYDFVIYER